MDTLIIENIRCFGSRQEVPIKPLTLLVGENSTGKTTFLAVFKIALELGRIGPGPNFNAEPFQLGAFDQIIHSKVGRETSAFFSIGCEISSRGKREPSAKFLTIFRKSGAQPQPFSWTLSLPNYEIKLELEKDERWTLHFSGPDEHFSGNLEHQAPGWFPGMRSMGIPGPMAVALSLGGFGKVKNGKTERQKNGRNRKYVQRLLRMAEDLYVQSGFGLRALAPIRSEPLRTYDLFTDTPEPAGSHIPSVLASTHAQGGSVWEQVRTALDSFGSTCGLFDSLSIRRLGKTESDPFQIVVNVSGPQVNLIDVGYGVSQVLPVLTEPILPGAPKTFLLQQPEVHLHPRAQAELGTFFGTMVRDHGKRFVIETHSDHLIDRVRMDVRDGKTVSPDDVIILYFERKGGEVIIHPLKIDGSGNLLDAPPGYRDFFLREESRFLGVD